MIQKLRKDGALQSLRSIPKILTSPRNAKFRLEQHHDHAPLDNDYRFDFASGQFGVSANYGEGGEESGGY